MVKRYILLLDVDEVGVERLLELLAFLSSVGVSGDAYFNSAIFIIDHYAKYDVNSLKSLIVEKIGNTEIMTIEVKSWSAKVKGGFNTFLSRRFTVADNSAQGAIKVKPLSDQLNRLKSKFSSTFLTTHSAHFLRRK